MFALVALAVATAVMSPKPVAAQPLESCDHGRATRTGSDPYAVAAAIAGGLESAETVFIATGIDFPDAITVGPVAALHGAPLLLTRPTSLPPVTERVLERLDPNRVVILGGPAVVGTHVEGDLRSRFPEVLRLAGPDRYGTAAAISQWQFPEPARVDTVYLARDGTYFDSLIAGSRAMYDYAPILFVGSDTVPATTAEELTRLDPVRIVVVSPHDIVTDDVVAQLAAFAPSVERLDMPNRFSVRLDGGRGIVAAAMAHHNRTACGPQALTVTEPPPSEAPCPAGRVALTYDDGPRPERTDAVIDALDRAGIRGTFFVVGDRAASSPETLRRIHEHGHVIANHTWAHVNLRGLDDAEIATSVTDTDRQIRDLGVPALRLVRPPFGATDRRVRQALNDAGFEQIKWNLNPKDWSGTGTSDIHDIVASGARDGSVVTLHDGTANYAETAAATEQIAATLHERGFCFGVLGEEGNVVP